MKKGKEEPIKRSHLWVFSGAIARIEGQPKEGEVVEVFSYDKQWLALGHYHDNSIAVRIISFQPVEVNTTFWADKLKSALELRYNLGLLQNPLTNCFRLVNGEGDGFSGLIIDVYKDTAIFQAHSIGMHLSRTEIVKALLSLPNSSVQFVYDKSKNTLPEKYAQTVTEQFISPIKPEIHAQLIKENGVCFHIDYVQGQKTGFFLDQRVNRELLSRYSFGKTVLNTFSYSGGFSLYALLAGAKEVISVDASAKATDLISKNLSLNPVEFSKHQTFTQDVLKFLQASEQSFDIIVLDPPAYAKSINKRHQAVQGYKRLNIEGIKKLNKGGILFTFSCSQVVDKQLFQDTVAAAAIETGRKVRILHHLSQPADHPTNMFHSEGAYLKGLVLYVE